MGRFRLPASRDTRTSLYIEIHGRTRKNTEEHGIISTNNRCCPVISLSHLLHPCSRDLLPTGAGTVVSCVPRRWNYGRRISIRLVPSVTNISASAV